jgi:hypothetical protein
MRVFEPVLLAIPLLGFGLFGQSGDPGKAPDHMERRFVSPIPVSDRRRRYRTNLKALS